MSQNQYGYGDPFGSAPGLEGKTLPQRDAEVVINAQVSMEMHDQRLANVAENRSYFTSCTPTKSNMDALLNEVVFIDIRDEFTLARDMQGNPNIFSNFAGIQEQPADPVDIQTLGPEEAMYLALCDKIIPIGIVGRSTSLNNQGLALEKCTVVIDGPMPTHIRSHHDVDAGHLYRMVMPRRDPVTHAAVFTHAEHVDRDRTKILGEMRPADGDNFKYENSLKHARYVLGRMTTTPQLFKWGRVARAALFDYMLVYQAAFPPVAAGAALLVPNPAPGDAIPDSAHGGVVADRPGLTTFWGGFAQPGQAEVLTQALYKFINAVKEMQLFEKKDLLFTAIVSAQNDRTGHFLIRKVA
jgi:hypothetical protein